MTRRTVVARSAARSAPAALIVFVAAAALAQTPDRPAADQQAQQPGRTVTDDDAARAWLLNRAVRLDTVEAGRGFTDMQPLKAIVGSARVVSLGEATHGTREFFQLKHRMLEFLVSEMGFTVLAIEATMPESFDVNRYVLTGEGDPVKALAGLYFWTWDTEEVLDMIRWMRQYNADPAHARKVKFYGIDMQMAARAAKVALGYLRRVDPGEAERAAADLALLANPYTESRFAKRPADEQARAADAIRSVLSALDARKADYVRQTSEDEWAVARQHARVLEQNIEMQRASALASQAVRDRSMAENVGWILDREGPGARVVVWAHNGHVATRTDLGVERTGSHLRRMLGRDLIVFGFSFNQGAFQAIELPLPSERGLTVFNIGPARAGSLDSMLASTGLPVAAFDLRGLPAEGPVATWFSGARAMRSIGALYRDQLGAWSYDSSPASRSYDAILFVERTTAARPVTPREDPRQRLQAPSNTDFEGGRIEDRPADWRMPSALDRFDFEFRLDDVRPYDGRRSAVIGRNPGAHYGEMAGSFAQRLDASQFAGRTIRLRVAARAELLGSDSRAWVSLVVTRKTAGAESVVFDSADQCPVSSSEWRVYTIVADVPSEADAIAYGLVLVGDGSAWLDAVSVEVVDIISVH